MDMNSAWQPPEDAPVPAQVVQRSPRRAWLPAAIIGLAIVVAAAVVAGALVFRSSRSGGTCQAWAETRQTLRAIPALPKDWSWATPNIDEDIKRQNAPVGAALDNFQGKIAAKPADVAQAAKDYVAIRRHQINTLADHSYVRATGDAVDAALANLDQACGITS